METLTVEKLKQLFDMVPNINGFHKLLDDQSVAENIKKGLFTILQSEGIQQSTVKYENEKGQIEQAHLYEYDKNNVDQLNAISAYVRYWNYTDKIPEDEKETYFIHTSDDKGTYTARINFDADKDHRDYSLYPVVTENPEDGILKCTDKHTKYDEHTNEKLKILLEAHEPARHDLYAVLPQTSIRPGSRRTAREIVNNLLDPEDKKKLNPDEKKQEEALKLAKDFYGGFGKLQIRHPNQNAARMIALILGKP